MWRWGMRALVVPTALLLSGCGQSEPESTLDGIFTTGQAQRGAGLFEQHCARCHSVQEFSGRRFDVVWAGVPASALFYRIANTMPLDQPGSLDTSQVTALMAHIFTANGMPSGETPLAADVDWLAGITLARPGP